MGSIVSIANSATRRITPTQEERDTEISKLIKIRKVIRARRMSNSDRREFVSSIAAQSGMPADVEAQLQTNVESLADACGPITDADIHAAIDAEIRIIREQMTRDEVFDAFDEDTGNNYVFNNALDALDWLRGEGPAPSEGWLDDESESVN